MRRHNRRLFRTARSILKTDDDTQDVLQEAYLKAWRALAGFQGDAKLSTGLVRFVVNEALGRLRQTGAQVMPLCAAIDTQEGSHMPEEQMPANPDEQPEPLAVRAQQEGLVGF
jgi:RNA polymerase sigma-70 factor (ECF subfamily)